MASLANRVAVGTGAGRDRSIGGGIARVLARHGADVVVHDLAVTDEGLRRVREIEELGRRSARPAPSAEVAEWARGVGAGAEVRPSSATRGWR
jgi:NAD(P)-dependent dehydrogenase (short-subunit alcohol dehydrogenase family)